MISQDPELNDPAIKAMHYCYTLVFLLEFLVRCTVESWVKLCGPEGWWNILDAFLIFSGILEIILESAAGPKLQGGSVMQFVRISRLMRTVRLMRSFKQFHDFQKMAYALACSFKTLLCSMAILMFVMFFFAVWFTQSAADSDARQHIQDLDVRYGDLMSTTFTLFSSVANGVDWDDCFTPLHELSWINGQVFIVYIIIVTFGVLNVVTSVFVDSVIQSVQHHKDMMLQEKDQQRALAMAHLKDVFLQADKDGSGEISCDEMQLFFQNPEMREYMEALDIKVDDTELLCNLLDVDNSGHVSAEEFCQGCLRLKGNARSIDIHSLTFQIANFLRKWSEFTVFVEDSFDAIRSSNHEPC